jgi:pyruvate/oxaloacetate carboxyltransferase
MSTDSAKGYIKQMEHISDAAGEVGVNTVDNALDALANGMSQSDFNSFMGQLNAMDWKNLDDWEDLPNKLKELGVSVPSKQLENFINIAKDTAGAIHTIDFTKLNESISELASLSSKIRSGE